MTQRHVSNSKVMISVRSPKSNEAGCSDIKRYFQGVFFYMILLSSLYTASSRGDTLPDFNSLIEKESEAVVKIFVVTGNDDQSSNRESDQIPEQWRRFFKQFPQNEPRPPRQGQGFGSGFILSEDGYVITNAHVVKNATDIRVGLQNRQEFSAEVIGMDDLTDIALLKIEADNLPVVSLGDSDGVKVGQWVLAIGSPFGFEYSATQGIVSAVARNLPTDTYVPFIQTDVAVNPGNSGGPLFNTDGEVIGVNSQIYSRSGGYQGLSFAIPINVVKNISDQLRNKGYASRGWLGVMIQDVNQDLAESFGLSKPTGALIVNVTKNSPADRAGLKTGDIIIEFGDDKVLRSGNLPILVGAVPISSTVEIMVLRDGEKQSFDAMISEIDSAKSSATIENQGNNKTLGLVIGNLTNGERESLNVEYGVLVKEVQPGSPAAEADLQPGDVIVTLDRKPIRNVKELVDTTKQLRNNQLFPVLIQRGESASYRAMKIPSQQ